MYGRKTIVASPRGGIGGCHGMGCDDTSGEIQRAAMRKIRKPAGGVGSASQQRIGMHLQALYQRVLSQPVPDRFVDLIARLEPDPRDLDPSRRETATEEDDGAAAPGSANGAKPTS